MRGLFIIVGFIVVIFICFGLLCASWIKGLGPEFHVEEARAVSPSREWTAVAFRYGHHAWGQESRHHIVRISQRGDPERGFVVWNSDEVPVSRVLWKGDDSVLVSVDIRNDQYVPWLLTTMKTHRSHGIASRTVVALVPIEPIDAPK